MENTQMPDFELTYARSISNRVPRSQQPTTAIAGNPQPLTGYRRGWWPKANTLCWEGAYHQDAKVGLWRYYAKIHTSKSHTDIHFNL